MSNSFESLTNEDTGVDIINGNQQEEVLEKGENKRARQAEYEGLGHQQLWQ